MSIASYSWNLGDSTRKFAVTLALLTVVASLADSSPVQGQCKDAEGYDLKTGKCYPFGTEGPCGNHSSFVSGTNGTSTCACLPISGRKNCGTRPTGLWREDSNCYPIFSQGPCHEGEWLEMTANITEVKCVPTPCKIGILSNTTKYLPADGVDETDFIFHQDGQCYETGTQAFCKTGEIALIGPGQSSPTCYNEKNGACNFISLLSSAKIGPANCGAGKTPTVSGECASVSQI